MYSYLRNTTLVFSEERLETNALVKAAGSLSVEILDPAGHRIEGFGPSEPFRGDHLRQHITWRGGKSVSDLRGKPISLKFHLN